MQDRPASKLNVLKFKDNEPESSAFTAPSSLQNEENLPDLPNKKELEELALNAPNAVGPHTYELVDLKNTSPTFFIVGCQGSGKEAQKKVAKLMNDLASNKRAIPDFILFLGDNVYDYGADSPIDKALYTCFHTIYGSESLKYVAKIPCFLILGNHDGNFHKKARLKSFSFIQGKVLELNQVAHTYIPDGKKYHSTEELVRLFSQDTLSLHGLQAFNMPYFFYSLIAGKTQIFCLDSNFIVSDFIDYVESVLSSEETKSFSNQITWLLSEYQRAKEAKREIIIAMHHAPTTSGKRSLEGGYDSHHYLTAEQIEKVNSILQISTRSYNELISVILKTCNIKADKILAAHDHFLCLDDNEDGLFITSGGGGGDLQARATCKRHPEVKLFLSKNGLQIYSKQGIETHTVSGIHTIYDDKNHTFVHDENSNRKVQALRKIVLETCNQFLLDIKNRENIQIEESKKSYTIGSSIFGIFTSLSKIISDPQAEEVACASKLMAYFNQIHLSDYDVVYAKLIKCLEKLSDKISDTSLYNIFQLALKCIMVSEPTHEPKIAC